MFGFDFAPPRIDFDPKEVSNSFGGKCLGTPIFSICTVGLQNRIQTWSKCVFG